MTVAYDIEMSEKLLTRWLTYMHNHSKIQSYKILDEDGEAPVPRTSTLTRMAPHGDPKIQHEDTHPL